MKAHTHSPAAVGKTLDLSEFPVDMSYAFLSILLFSKALPPYKSVETTGGTSLAVPPFSILSRPSDVFANSEDFVLR